MAEQESVVETEWYASGRWPARVLFVLLIAAAFAPSGPRIGSNALEVAISVGAFLLIIAWGWVVWRGSGQESRRMGLIERIITWVFVGLFALCVVGRWIGFGPLALD